MKYTKEERYQIGKDIYNHVITISEAAEKYEIDWYTARNYMRTYKKINNLPPMNDGTRRTKKIKENKYEFLNTLTKDELIDELIKARIEAERAKKGYVVINKDRKKKFINLSDLKTK